MCPVCRHALPGSAPEGLCPKCLWATLMNPELPAGGDDAETLAGSGAEVLIGGDYELLGEIARGGMGVIYRARQTTLNRVVALKMVLTARLPGEEEMRRFRAEAEAVASLEHPNIIPIHEVGEAEGRPYFTMKYVPGGSLADRLAATPVASPDKAAPAGPGGPDLKDAVTLVAKIARAVHHAHQRGILHRDLKPSNILLDDNGEPLVTDFGLAKDLEGDSQLTLSGAVLGTPAYMAPEQAASGKSLTTAADVYSLGAIFYELLTGRPPFQAGTPLETLRQVTETDPRRPGSLNPGLARDLETICLKCLQRTPAQRYGSAEALAEDLERWLRHEPINARPVGVGERMLKWGRRHPALAALILVAVIVPGLVIGILLSGNARVQAANLQTRRNLYAADMLLADRALREGNLGLARVTLANHIPEPAKRAGPEDFRGFEWRWAWQQSQGDQLRVLSGFPRPPTALAIAPDGRTLAIAGQHYLWRWNLDEPAGTELLPPKESRWLEGDEAAKLIARVHMTPYLTNQVSATNPAPGDFSAWVNPERMDRTSRLSFTPDGRQVLSSGRQTARAARVWNLADGSLAFALPANASDAAMSPVAPLAAVGSYALPGARGCVKLYDLERRAEVGVLAGSGGLVAFSGDGQLLATVDTDDSLATSHVRLWSMPDRRPRGQFATGKVWNLLALSPDGDHVALAGLDAPVVELWSCKQGRLAHRLVAHQGAIRALAFSPDSRLLATAGADQLVRLWAVASGAVTATLRGHADEVASLAFFPDGQRLASAGRDGTVRLWRTVPAPTEGRQSGDGATGSRLLVAPDSRWWTSTIIGWRGLRLWDTRPGGGSRVLNWNNELARNEGFDDGGRTIVSSVHPAGGDQMRLEWRSLADFALTRSVTLAGELDRNEPRSFCPAAGLFAAGRRDGVVRMWSARTGALLHTLELPDHIDGHARANNLVNRVAISPDGSLLAAGLEANTQVAVYSLPEGRLLYSHHVRPLFVVVDNPVDPGLLAFLDFSPDGKWLVHTDLTEPGIRLREARTGRELGRLPGHRDHTVAVAFAPDGRTLASTGGDGSVKLWHLPTLREVATLVETNAEGPLAFSPDGNLLLVALSDQVRVFRVASLAEIDAGH